jgi:hypothetical protein
MVVENASMPTLSHAFSGALRTFSFWVANGTAGIPLLEDIDYRKVILEEPGLLERVYAIFANVIELDDDGAPVNAKWAEHRAAQYIRAYVTGDHDVRPPFEDRELALHEPPPLEDPKPWPSG